MKTKREQSEEWWLQLWAKDPQLTRAISCLDLRFDEMTDCEKPDQIPAIRCGRDELWKIGLQFAQSFAPQLWNDIFVRVTQTGQAQDEKSRAHEYSLLEFHHHYVTPWLYEAIENRDLVCQRRPIIAATDLNEVVACEYELKHESAEARSVSTDALFKFADQFGLHQELHWAVIESCLAQCFKPLANRKAFLNVDPVRFFDEDYLWPEILDATAENAYDSQSIVFEVSMIGQGDAKLLAGFANEIRQRGFEVALDNWGLENNSLHTLDLIRPDYLKVSRVLTSGAHGDSYRDTLLTGLVRMATDLGLTIVAEGISCEKDFYRAAESGFHWLQGDYVGKPASLETPHASSVLPGSFGKQFENILSGNC